MFVSASASRYCSEACRRESWRAAGLRHYYKVKAANPDISRQQHQRRREKLAADPEALAAYRQKEQARSRLRQSRLRSDPQLKEAVYQRMRKRYAARAEIIQARQRERLSERLEAMSPQERPAKQKREKIIIIKLSDAEHKRLKVIAAREKKTMTDLVRRAIHDAEMI
jgi:predicted HicB family RNase H-like nuclease